MKKYDDDKEIFQLLLYFMTQETDFYHHQKTVTNNINNITSSESKIFFQKVRSSWACAIIAMINDRIIRDLRKKFYFCTGHNTWHNEPHEKWMKISFQ